jgi:hypothetical protein
VESFGARWIDRVGAARETLEVSWDNGGWTAQGHSTTLACQYVVRLSPTWQVRQFLLFRDFDEPDLWLATDGGGRWGEMNGAHRTDLDGCSDLAIVGSAFSPTMPVRRLPLQVGDSAEVRTAEIDTELLLVLPVHERYTRLGERRWRKETITSAADPLEWEVDEHGLAHSLAGGFDLAE